METAASFHPGAPRRGAFTLVELLVAMALTLLLVYGMAEFYAYVGDTVRDGRAIVEMGSDIRNAVRQLREDLNSVTVQPKPPIADSGAQGFLEIVEGVASDIDFNGNGTPGDPNLEFADINGDNLVEGRMLGDVDDILTMTIRSSGQPFTAHYQFYDQNSGQFQQRTVASHLAEVVWFTTFKDVNNDGGWDPGEPPGNDLDTDGRNPEFEEPRFLVRRMFLIAPNIEGWRDNGGTIHYGEIVDPNFANPAGALPDNVFQRNDLSLAAPYFNSSLGMSGGWVWKCNSLTTLTRRENRFVHLNLQNLSQNGLRASDATQPNAYLPNPLQMQAANTQSMQYYTLQGTKRGEDLVLPNLLAFDIRVYDPQVVLYGDPPTNPDTALQPGDPGYVTVLQTNQSTPNTYSPIGYGAYVDLNYNRYLGGTTFSTPFAAPSNDATPSYSTYDTWTMFYEHDGYNQDAALDMTTDEGTDGIDNDGQNGVDDAGEFETEPPYLTPLRGIQVRIRMYEPGTRQTRQATIVADFVQE